MIRLWMVLAAALAVSAQEAAPPPSMTAADPGFEVATIKPSDPNSTNRGYSLGPGRVASVNTTLANIITFAYDLHERQIEKGPGWIASDKYDVTGKPDADGQPNLEQVKSMFRKLLAERFALRFHREKKQLAVYAIGRAPNVALKMRESARDGERGMMFPRAGYLPARSATMAEFAGVLQRAVLDRPVVDQTGLTARYDFDLNWTPDQFQFASMATLPPQSEPAPNIFEAFRQQLGLQLEATRAAADVLVIDSVQRPAEN